MATPPQHPAAADETTLWSDCQVRRQRRSGPGGQHRNKVETAIVLTHQPTGITAEASERRSQAENRRVALRRLRLNLALGVRSTADLADSPSELWSSRCAAGRVQVSPDHGDFPVLLAEVLDALTAVDWQISDAAQWLKCTASQLVKFLKLEPRALSMLNRIRQEHGLRPLK